MGNGQRSDLSTRECAEGTHHDVHPLAKRPVSDLSKALHVALEVEQEAQLGHGQVFEVVRVGELGVLGQEGTLGTNQDGIFGVVGLQGRHRVAEVGGGGDGWVERDVFESGEKEARRGSRKATLFSILKTAQSLGGGTYLSSYSPDMRSMLLSVYWPELDPIPMPSSALTNNNNQNLASAIHIETNEDRTQKRLRT